MNLTQFPGYVRFWIASTVSDFGTHVTSIAISVIVVLRLDGSPSDVGLVSAARWLPYLLFGLFAGLLVDRYPRKPVLVAADVSRAAILATIAVLGLAGWLTLSGLLSLIFAFGTLSLVGDAAFQSFIPQLVPRELLVRANARLQQSDSVAQTAGPAVAGWLTQLLTAPAALLLDAASYLVSGFVVASIPGSPMTGEPTPTSGFGHRIAEGLRWIYRHPRLGPLVLGTHLWFLFFSMFGAVFTVYALRERDLGVGGLGVVLACAGAGSVVGAAMSLRIGNAVGAGKTIILARAVYPVAFLIIAGAGSVAAGGWLCLVLIAAGQSLIGLALGAEGPQEMGYEQAVTPARLMGRMAAIRRSANRGMIVLGAPLGGLLAETAGYRPAMCLAAVGMAAVVAFMIITGFWRARIEDHLSGDEANAG